MTGEATDQEKDATYAHPAKDGSPERRTGVHIPVRKAEPIKDSSARGDTRALRTAPRHGPPTVSTPAAPEPGSCHSPQARGARGTGLTQEAVLTPCPMRQHTATHREGPPATPSACLTRGTSQQGAFWAEAAGSAVTGAAAHGRSPRAHWAAHAMDNGPEPASPGDVAR